jgi:ubiquinone biosynthesis protein
MMRRVTAVVQSEAQVDARSATATERWKMSASEIPRSGWLDTALRLQRIGVVLARHGFGEVVSRIGVAIPRLPGAALPPSSHERLARRLADVLTDLGPTYVKLGQLLATRADLFSPEVVRTLSTLHASVRPMSFRVVAKMLDAELGQPHWRAFAHVDSACLAAASIAQVHRATLHDGRAVAVKVQRPDLRVQVEADLGIMLLVARLLDQHVPEVAAYAPVSLVESFARSITSELDFRNEAENARTLRRLLGDAPEVYVPAIHESWTTQRLLVMEFVAGTRLADLPASARASARHALLRAFVRQTLEHGVFHADPHPGNVLMSPGGRLVLLDHGIVAVLAEPVRTRLLQLSIALLFRRHAALCEHVIALSEVSDARAIDRERLHRDVSGVLRATAHGGGAGMFGQLMAMSRVHGLRLPAALLAFMRALAILDGVLRGLDPAADVVRELRRELAWSSLRHARQISVASARGLVRLGIRHGRHVLRVVGERVRLTVRSAGGAWRGAAGALNATWQRRPRISQWVRGAVLSARDTAGATRRQIATVAASASRALGRALHIIQQRRHRAWQWTCAALGHIGGALQASWQSRGRTPQRPRMPAHLRAVPRTGWLRRERTSRWARGALAVFRSREARSGVQNGMSSSSCVAPPAPPPRLGPASSSRGGGGLSS